MRISVLPGFTVNSSGGMRASTVATITLTLLLGAIHTNTAASAPLFAAPFLSFDAGGNPYSVTIGDLHGDGQPDLAVANYIISSVSVLLGNGDGSFAAHADFWTGSYPITLAIGDLNADGKPDLAVANSVNPFTGTVSVLLGNGDGSFGIKTDYDTGPGPSSVAIGDLNGDGKPDLAT